MAFLFSTFVVILYFIISASVEDTSGLIIFSSIYVGLIRGVLCDILFIMLTRWQLRWSMGFESFTKICVIILLNCIAAILLVIGPILIMILSLMLWGGSDTGLSRGLETAWWVTSYSNVFGAMFALAFVFLAIIMLLHRIFWELLERPVYALQKLGLARRSKLLGTIGTILITAAVGGLPWLEKIVEMLNPF